MPQRVEKPKHGGRVTGADDSAGENIAGIMHAIVNTREADKAGEREHYPDAPAIVDERDHGACEPVGGVCGRHAVEARRLRLWRRRAGAFGSFLV